MRALKGTVKSKRYISMLLIAMMVILLAGCGKKVEEEEVERVSIIGDITENTLIFSSNGTVLEISCQDYSQDQIDVSGLEDYIQTEIDDYNNNLGINKISLQEYIEDDGFVRTAIRYSDVDAYNEFNMLDMNVSMYRAESADEIARADMASITNAIVTVEPTEINEEELAGTGYDLEDIEEMETGTYDASSASDAEEELDEATFTDASTMDTVKSDEINNDSYMMFISDKPMNYKIDGGSILYFNKNAELIDASTVRVTGESKAVVVYNYNF